MSGERGRRVEFWLFIPASPSLSSGLLSPIPYFGCPRLRTNERTPPIELPATSPYPPRAAPLLPSSVLYTNVTTFSQDPLVLTNPPPINTTYLYLFSFLAHFLPVFYQTLRPTTLYYPRPTYLCAFPSTFTFRFFILFEAELPILFYLLLFTSTSASTLCELQCRNNIGWLVEI